MVDNNNNIDGWMAKNATISYFQLRESDVGEVFFNV
jgi:hypothetical protein